MKRLLDTHIWLRSLQGSDKLGKGESFVRNAGVIILILMLGTAASWCADLNQKPGLQFDLTSFGYVKQNKHARLTDYTTIGFLSETLLLVAINQRQFHAADPLFSYTPDSTIVIFDVDKRQAIQVGHMPLFKAQRSVAALLNNHFVVLMPSQVQICSIDMKCERAFPTPGPLWVSRKRDEVVVGGNLRSQRFLLDAETLALIENHDQDSVRIPAEQDMLSGPGGATAEIESTMDEKRQLQNVKSYTRRNKILNPLGDLGDRPYNSQEVTIYDKSSKKEIFRMQFDPRPEAPASPAISPTGHRMAVLVRGVLEVFDIP